MIIEYNLIEHDHKNEEQYLSVDNCRFPLVPVPLTKTYYVRTALVREIQIITSP
jgi:hypothetical protein